MMYLQKNIWDSLSKLSATAILRGQLTPGNTVPFLKVHAEITAA
jgi:hypothetical protein